MPRMRPSSALLRKAWSQDCELIILMDYVILSVTSAIAGKIGVLEFRRSPGMLLHGCGKDSCRRRSPARELADLWDYRIRFFERFEDLVYEKKKEVMDSLLAVEMRSLGHHLSLMAEQDRYARDLPVAELTPALIETTACLSVYRTYTRDSTVALSDRDYIVQALEAARRRNRKLNPAYFDFLGDVLLLREKVHLSPAQREARLAFVMRWQQFTGPFMAKGFEDTVLYIYNPLVSLNEVGGNPASSGVSLTTFQEFVQRRLNAWPHSLNATTTHDTKRSEDVRARVNILSEIPTEWRKRLNR